MSLRYQKKNFQSSNFWFKGFLKPDALMLGKMSFPKKFLLQRKFVTSTQLCHFDTNLSLLTSVTCGSDRFLLKSRVEVTNFGAEKEYPFKISKKNLNPQLIIFFFKLQLQNFDNSAAIVEK